jgi:hypothetical protein
MRFPVGRQRFPITIISEIIVTTSGPRRNQLLRVCRTLCIEPHYKILRLSENGAEGQSEDRRGYDFAQVSGQQYSTCQRPLIRIFSRGGKTPTPISPCSSKPSPSTQNRSDSLPSSASTRVSAWTNAVSRRAPDLADVESKSTERAIFAPRSRLLTASLAACTPTASVPNFLSHNRGSSQNLVPTWSKCCQIGSKTE